MKFIKFCLATCLVVASMSSVSIFAQEKEVKFALDFIPLGRHAPWYVALNKGYFKEEKLNVTILPTKGTADAVRYLESGLSEFAFIDIPSLVASGSAGKSIRSSLRTASAVDPFASQPAPESAPVRVIANGAAATVTTSQTAITIRRCLAINAAIRENQAFSLGSGEASCPTYNSDSSTCIIFPNS